MVVTRHVIVELCVRYMLYAGPCGVMTKVWPLVRNLRPCYIFLSVAQYNGYLKALWINYESYELYNIVSELSYTLFQRRKKDNLYKIVVIFFEGVQDHL